MQKLNKKEIPIRKNSKLFNQRKRTLEFSPFRIILYLIGYYVAGIQRYNVEIDTPRSFATS